ncbi:hypothetical protein [Paractinoplanes maris]|uniref:hypothetical protein n=1 Tax=Paractinoplanes maris TaxID=1734446 RepID=UPI002020AB37|nr:hypothetical protein [Actinoplanes maris]
MTAPGDLVLISVLVALFVASCGYAAGRLHQRYQLRQDREEAYRDGYETASSRVFSLAARIAAPKRAGRPARGAAAVQPSPPPAEPAPAPFPDPGRAVRHQGVAAKAAGPDPSPAGSFGFPVPPPPPPNTLAEPAAVGGLSFQPLRDPRPADGSGPVLGRRPSPFPLPTSPLIAAATSTSTPASASSPVSPLSPISPSLPALSSSPVSPSSPALSSSPGSPSSPALPSSPVSSSPALPSSPVSSPDEPAPRVGKHTVPDELVQGATYRLPPDRIFRAKVPNSTPLPEQTTTHLSVPKPRRRTDENVAPPS